MKKAILLIIVIGSNYIINAQNYELKNFISNWDSIAIKKKIKKKELKKIGKYKVSRSTMYHGGKLRYSKMYLYGDTLEVSCKKSNLFGAYYINSILIKYPISYSTDEGVTVGITEKKDLFRKFGEPTYQFGFEYSYNKTTYFLPDSVNVKYPLNYDRVKHLRERVVAIKFRK